MTPPRLGILGCVESEALKGYVDALEAEHHSARARALAGLHIEERVTRFVEAPAGALLEAAARDREAERTASRSRRERARGESASAEQRAAVIARLAVESPPRVRLVREGQVLRTIDERPRSHPVHVHVCGVEPCPPVRGGARRPTRALAIDLEPGEVLGEPLQISYDYWWASVTYREQRSCPAAARDERLVPRR